MVVTFFKVAMYTPFSIFNKSTFFGTVEKTNEKELYIFIKTKT